MDRPFKISKILQIKVTLIYNVLLTYVEVVFASCRKWLAVNKQILQELEDKTDIFAFYFSGGAALPESPVQLFKSRNAWSCSRCHSELVGMLLAAQYRHSGGSQERERTSNSCWTTPYGGWQSCLCSGHCPQKSCHWPTKQRTHRWVKSMFFFKVISCYHVSIPSNPAAQYSFIRSKTNNKITRKWDCLVCQILQFASKKAEFSVFRA